MTPTASDLVYGTFSALATIIAIAACLVIRDRKRNVWPFWIMLSLVSAAWALVGTWNTLAADGSIEQVPALPCILIAAILLTVLPMAFLAGKLARVIRSMSSVQDESGEAQPKSTIR